MNKQDLQDMFFKSLMERDRDAYEVFLDAYEETNPLSKKLLMESTSLLGAVLALRKKEGRIQGLLPARRTKCSGCADRPISKRHYHIQFTVGPTTFLFNVLNNEADAARAHGLQVQLEDSSCWITSSRRRAMISKSIRRLIDGKTAYYTKMSGSSSPWIRRHDNTGQIEMVSARSHRISSPIVDYVIQVTAQAYSEYDTVWSIMNQSE